MANERTTGQPLAATVGERLGERAREGDTAGLDRAQEVVEDLRGAGWQAGAGEARGRATGEGHARPPEGADVAARAGERTRPGKPSAPIGWAVAAGLGTWVVVGMIARAFRR